MRVSKKSGPSISCPRIVAAEEWDRLERGLKQRIRALNLFIDDIYHDQQIVKDDVVPEAILKSATSFRNSASA